MEIVKFLLLMLKVSKFSMFRCVHGLLSFGAMGLHNYKMSKYVDNLLRTPVIMRNLSTDRGHVIFVQEEEGALLPVSGSER